MVPSRAPCRGGSVSSLTPSLHIAQLLGGLPFAHSETEVVSSFPVGGTPWGPAASPRLAPLHLACLAKEGEATDADVCRVCGGWDMGRFPS